MLAAITESSVLVTKTSLHEFLESVCRRDVSTSSCVGMCYSRWLHVAKLLAYCIKLARAEAEAFEIASRNLLSNAPPIRSLREISPTTLLTLSTTIRCLSPSVRNMTNVRYRENFFGTHGAEWLMNGSCTI